MSDLDLEDIPAETPLSPEEAVIRRHRREKKELQGKILAMKKAVTKNDKKKKKDISEEITRLEDELTTRHKAELDSFRINRPVENVEQSLGKKIENISLDEIVNKSETGLETPEVLSTPGTPRMSKARKRREKKTIEERERQKRIEQETEQLVGNSERTKENKKLEEILREMNLKVHDIPPDGHCLYAAVSHQLGYHQIQPETVPSLRSRVSTFLLENRDEFISYMDENLANSREEFEKYCRDIKDTSCWGGQIEVQVLSRILGKQIRVIQAEGPCLFFGEKYSKPSLDLIFHRHMLQLGAHYNSAVSQN